jgi:hypothetical protein
VDSTCGHDKFSEFVIHYWLDPTTALGTSTIASACAFDAKKVVFLTGLTGLTSYYKSS